MIPPPNLCCRYFTHSTELILWSARDGRSKHYFDYPAMKAENGGKQMKNIWRLPTPGAAEKRHGKHPTQKPVALVARCLRASTNAGDLVLDLFAGSGSSGVAALELGRRFIGIEGDAAYAALAAKRLRAAVREAAVTSPAGPA